MDPKTITLLDPVIHSRIRLAVVSVLVSLKQADFSYLKQSIGASDGNLSVHLTKLEESGYISIKKTYKGKKPHTLCSLTDKGRKAFSDYLEALDSLLHHKKE